MATILQIFSNWFSLMKILFWFKFHLKCSPRVKLTIFQHWLRWWLSTEQVASHYLEPTMAQFTDTYTLFCLNELRSGWDEWVIKFNTLRPRQNGRRFADDTFKRIFWNENVRILIKFSLKFVPKGPINNIPALVQIMAWRRPGDKPLSKPIMVSLPTHICVARPQWVNSLSWTADSEVHIIIAYALE